jgi:hypothetical protein
MKAKSLKNYPSLPLVTGHQNDFSFFLQAIDPLSPPPPTHHRLPHTIDTHINRDSDPVRSSPCRSLPLPGRPPLPYFVLVSDEDTLELPQVNDDMDKMKLTSFKKPKQMRKQRETDVKETIA